jgi:hypothetical protein
LNTGPSECKAGVLTPPQLLVISVFWVLTPCSLFVVTKVSDEHAASILSIDSDNHSKEISILLCKTTVNYRAYRILLLSLVNPVHTIILCYVTSCLHFYITGSKPIPSGLFLSRVPIKALCDYPALSMHATCSSCTSQSYLS